jgi:hypothetical protein
MKRNVMNVTNKQIEKNEYINNNDMAANLSMVWEVTQNVWAFVGGNNAEQRLQRNVTNINRRKS